MAMALNRDKQRLAQEEIDRVIGTERLPTIKDRPNLPYVNALIKEVMRWNPAVPLGEFPCADPRYASPVWVGGGCAD